ncbi:Zinc finger, C2H2 type [Popillia japonica]|uniref:Zinc finger, C2H2 type n=1 Tax=Popillia japonica TaxID=7064 RepID=A0AAW1L6N7_POPJA
MVIKIRDAYICALCNRKYNSKSTLLRHQRYECGAEKQYQCSQCQRGFYHKHQLKDHILRRHLPDIHLPSIK